MSLLRLSGCRFIFAQHVVLALVLVTGCDESVRVVRRGGGTGSSEPLVALAVTPTAGDVEIGPKRRFQVRLSTEVDPTTADDAMILAEASTGERVAGSVVLLTPANLNEALLAFEPAAGKLRANARYELTLSPDLMSDDGRELDLEASASIVPTTYRTFRVEPALDGTIQAAPTSCSAMEVVWEDAVVSDNSPAEDITYRIFASADSAQFDLDHPALETAAGVRRTFVEGLQADTNYFVAIAAVDPLGNVSSLSPPASLRTPPPDRCDLTPPTFAGVEAVNVDILRPDTLEVSWVAGTDNQTAANDLRYNIFVSDQAGSAAGSTPFAQSGPGATSAELVGVATDTTLFVSVRSVDAAGNQDSNNVEIEVRTPASFRGDVQPILRLAPPQGGGCTDAFCHAAATRSGGLNLESYDGLVVEGGNTQAPRTIIPGDSVGSFLLWRTDETNPSFVRDSSRMPLGSPPLTRVQLSILARWIDQGAFDN